MRFSQRVLQHVCIALAALSLPLLAPRALSAATPGRAPVTSAVDGAVQASAILERRATPPFTERPAQSIVTAAGDTLESLAAAFHSDAAAMRWANGLHDLDQPRPATRLLVPPGAGALVRVTRQERLTDVATRLNVDPRVLLDYNVIPDDGPLPPGRWLQVPKAAAPSGSLDSAAVVPAEGGVPSVASAQNSHGVDRFPYGQCTYYVATRRNVTWGGDAWTWFDNARAAGRPTGQVPVAGAIAVTWGSWIGHVGYVERVNPDGSFVVSEMNVMGWAVYDQRTLRPESGIIGFIY